MSRVSAITAEFVGTAFLLAGVVGSGIMAERLSPNDTGLQLFENAFATAGILVALILAFREVSGAHFNPAVTLTALAFGEISLAARAPTSPPRSAEPSSGSCAPTSCSSSTS